MTGPDDDPVEERTDHPTPSGGVYSVARYSNASGPCPKSEATRVEIIEYDADGTAVGFVSGSIDPQPDA